MTQQPPTNGTPEDVPKQEPRPNPKREALFGLRAMLEHADPGALARLRRMDPERPPAEFFRFSVAVLDDLLPTTEARRRSQESRWAAIVKLMAIGLGTNPRGGGLLSAVPLGQSLAQAKIAEMRVLRLLDARDAQLMELARHVVHQLVSKGVSFRIDDFAHLLLSSGERAESARREIARSYYRHLND